MKHFMEHLPTQEILSSITPVKRHYPRSMAHQVHYLLSGQDIVQCNDLRVAGSSEKLSSGREGHGPYRLHETCILLVDCSLLGALDTNPVKNGVGALYHY